MNKLTFFATASLLAFCLASFTGTYASDPQEDLGQHSSPVSNPLGKAASTATPFSLKILIQNCGRFEHTDFSSREDRINAAKLLMHIHLAVDNLKALDKLTTILTDTSMHNFGVLIIVRDTFC